MTKNERELIDQYLRKISRARDAYQREVEEYLNQIRKLIAPKHEPTTDA